MMALRMTSAQRRAILRWVAKHSPDGEPYHAPDDVPQHMAGVDLGYALITLELEGLCGTEDPDIVWSTPEGLRAALA
jgi:hypothetical protein